MKRLIRMIYLKFTIKALKADLKETLVDAEIALLDGQNERSRDLKGVALNMRQTLFAKKAELEELENMKRGF